jgi:hypothetical protein
MESKNVASLDAAYCLHRAGERLSYGMECICSRCILSRQDPISCKNCVPGFVMRKPLLHPQKMPAEISWSSARVEFFFLQAAARVAEGYCGKLLKTLEK